MILCVVPPPPTLSLVSCVHQMVEENNSVPLSVSCYCVVFIVILYKLNRNRLM